MKTHRQCMSYPLSIVMVRAGEEFREFERRPLKFSAGPLLREAGKLCGRGFCPRPREGSDGERTENKCRHQSRVIMCGAELPTHGDIGWSRGTTTPPSRNHAS